MTTVLALLDKIVDSPTLFRLDMPILCSQYMTRHVAHAICLEVIQKPGPFDLHAVPETFYLDRSRLCEWHEQYQRLFYTATAMGYLDTFCQKYGATLSAEELLEQKTKLMTTLEFGTLTEPKDVAAHIGCILNLLLSKKGKTLPAPDENVLAQICEDICLGNHHVAKIINKRLGDQLSFYFLKGRLQDVSANQMKLYGVEQELSQLGKAIMPLLHLHVKVHGPFYKQNMEARLWKPLFSLLSAPEKPTQFPCLVAPLQESIAKAHSCIHKMTFILAGLTLVQQTILYSDMWDFDVALKHATMKELADSSGLIRMAQDPDVSKDHIEEKLFILMKQVADKEAIVVDGAYEKKFQRMLRLAKDNKTPGCRVFLDGIVGTFQQFITQGSMPNFHANRLIAEFIEEIRHICIQVQAIILETKQAHISEDVDPIAQEIPIARAGRV